MARQDTSEVTSIFVDNQKFLLTIRITKVYNYNNC